MESWSHISLLLFKITYSSLKFFKFCQSGKNSLNLYLFALHPCSQPIGVRVAAITVAWEGPHPRKSSANPSQSLSTKFPLSQNGLLTAPPHQQHTPSLLGRRIPNHLSKITSILHANESPWNSGSNRKITSPQSNVTKLNWGSEKAHTAMVMQSSAVPGNLGTNFDPPFSSWSFNGRTRQNTCRKTLLSYRKTLQVSDIRFLVKTSSALLENEMVKALKMMFANFHRK